MIKEDIKYTDELSDYKGKWKSFYFTKDGSCIYDVDDCWDTKDGADSDIIDTEMCISDHTMESVFLTPYGEKLINHINYSYAVAMPVGIK